MKTEPEIREELKNTEYQHIEITTKYYDARKQGLITQMFLSKEVIKIEQKIELLKWVLNEQ